MPLQDVAPIEASTEIDAPPAQVWALVSDLRNMARWSPQCVRTFVRGGGEVAQGSKMVNINRRGLLFWPTQSKVVRFTPEKEIAFRVKENWTIWSYTLEPTADRRHQADRQARGARRHLRRLGPADQDRPRRHRDLRLRARRRHRGDAGQDQGRRRALSRRIAPREHGVTAGRD